MAAAKIQAVLNVLCLIASAVSDPYPGRIPKVYNALITSNQNLEPSKAYPVYQPVIHDSFGFPYPGLYYGSGISISGTLLPDLLPKGRNSSPLPPVPSVESSEPPSSSPTEKVPNSDKSDDEAKTNIRLVNPPGSTQSPPLPPNTQSPILLNQFGLPPQVLPLGRFNPAYNRITQIGPYYPYPGFRFYDPVVLFSLNYSGPPFLYGPLGNGIGQSAPNAPAPASKNDDNLTPKTSLPKEDNPILPPPNTTTLYLNFRKHIV